MLINSEPHTDGYAYVPSRAVTSFLPAGVSLPPALPALYDADFAHDRVE